MNILLTTSTNSQPSTQTSRLITTSSPTIEQPSAWMRDGYSPTEIILAAAILTSFLMGGVATVIMAMTGLVKTLAPESDGKPNQPKKKII
ncbi:hypothetical protein [Anabaena sp. UHCC 0399]|uniref:hypothetical protein n=1 Tax=Anabaena sp. UHCC 0399 TaxID=3110238 RepID=UPI002B208F5B|nr:hypothetical protein [Anabaena sp. UHCC 0399]MEA5567667.1 hypothetical protein [Anabaena sp. UHCC 0399]